MEWLVSYIHVYLIDPSVGKTFPVVQYNGGKVNPILRCMYPLTPPRGFFSGPVELHISVHWNK